ncbi:MAG: hypothetical protein KDE19_22505 [Caldilineaceae bacterium]|nr:hypothetical protein [Caldilineaceae bacterium]
MRRVTVLAVLLIVVVIGVAASNARAQDDPAPTATAVDPAAQAAALLEEINSVQSLETLPPYILLVAQRTVPGAQFSGFQWDLSDNLRPLYELQGMQDNKQLEIGIFMDGSINRINRTITMSDVPVDVIGMLDKYVRDFEVSNVTEATLASGVHRFEFAGRSGGINLAVEIADSASQIRIVELQ